MRTTHHVVWAAASVAAVLAVSSMLTAGPLTPPSGPVASTNKTLDEVEPRTAVNATNTPGDNDLTPSLFKITQPGSYYLTGNIIGVSGKSGIEIAADGVTLDLMGFDLRGVTGSRNGVDANGTTDNLRIRNGSVRDWGGDGVNTQIARGPVLRNLAASGNGVIGLRVGSGGLAEGCTVQGNGSVGILASNGCTITGCAARDNGDRGLSAGNGSMISGCAATGNGGEGINVTSACTVVNCTAYFNGDGLPFDGAGIRALSGSTISGCTASFNTGDGIRVSTASVVVGNTCERNGFNGDGAGVFAVSSDNRVEGNNVTSNDFGVRAGAGDGNLIIRNSASGNTTNFFFGVGNTVGPTVTSATIATNSNPHANYAF